MSGSGCAVIVVGHVDHGKTALVRALTGVDTDRLAEEKARGLSITPGFAHLSFPEGTLDLIDAPGHEDFLEAMITGASGAAAALLVVAADEGPQAQTHEHLEILRLLGFDRILVALTKADLSDPVRSAEAASRVTQEILKADLVQAELVFVSAKTGEGMSQLAQHLRKLHRAVTQDRKATWPPQPFLPIDRVFSIPGQGTVVTGTLMGSDLSKENICQLLPQGLEVGLKGLQARGTSQETLRAGERAAVNLRGLARSEVRRGMVLAAGGQFAASRCMDVVLSISPQAPAPLRHMAEVRVHIGTSTAVARVSLYGQNELASGENGFAQLRFAQPMVGFGGQKILLRRLSPAATLGGGTVLDPLARKVRGGDRERLGLLKVAVNCDLDSIAKALSLAGGGVLKLEELARLARREPPLVASRLAQDYVALSKDQYASHQSLRQCEEHILQSLSEGHAESPIRAYLPLRMKARWAPDLVARCLADLVSGGQLKRRDERFALDHHDPLKAVSPEDKSHLERLEEAFRQGGLAPPKQEAVAPDRHSEMLLQLLLDIDRVVSLQNIALKQRVILHREALEEACTRLRKTFPNGTPFKTGAARDALQTSRRVIVPLLEHFDAKGVTTREGDERRMMGE